MTTLSEGSNDRREFKATKREASVERSETKLRKHEEQLIENSTRMFSYFDPFTIALFFEFRSFENFVILPLYYKNG